MESKQIDLPDYDDEEPDYGSENDEPSSKYDQSEINSDDTSINNGMPRVTRDQQQNESKQVEPV